MMINNTKYVMMASHTCRLEVLKRLVLFEVSESDPALQRFWLWRNAVCDRPSVQKTLLVAKDSEDRLCTVWCTCGVHVSDRA